MSYEAACKEGWLLFCTSSRKCSNSSNNWWSYSGFSSQRFFSKENKLLGFATSVIHWCQRCVTQLYFTACFPSSTFLIPRLLNSKKSEAQGGLLPTVGTPCVSSTQTPQIRELSVHLYPNKPVWIGKHGVIRCKGMNWFLLGKFLSCMFLALYILTEFHCLWVKSVIR